VSRDIDESSENVLSEWSRRIAADEAEGDADEPVQEDALLDDPARSAEPAPWGTAEARVEPIEEDQAIVSEEAEAEPDGADDGEAGPIVLEPSHEHAVGELEIPDGYAVLEGEAEGSRRAVGLVVSRFNGAVTSQLLERALAELDETGVPREAITIMVVPGAFELPLAATALAKTRRFACIVALGCVIRGDTPHFDYVAGEAASGLQLAALETGVPVSFGVLTLDRVDQAEARVEKGAEAVRTALEMADVFSHLRAAAAR
jgi:6,7-dimethyl-8-ribityllumazine synthase